MPEFTKTAKSIVHYYGGKRNIKCEIANIWRRKKDTKGTCKCIQKTTDNKNGKKQKEKHGLFLFNPVYTNGVIERSWKKNQISSLQPNLNLRCIQFKLKSCIKLQNSQTKWFNEYW